ncbi:hypothetical protein BY458DRAFT_527876 [Sporodiniella umbellata]|nr:hypothetical protein BY458DRAFT_527876 [Sporodiniella umbellata]
MNVSDLCSDLPTKSLSRSEIDYETTTNEAETENTQEQPQTIKDKSIHLYESLKHFQNTHDSLSIDKQNSVIKEMCALAKSLSEAVDELDGDSFKDYVDSDKEEDKNSFKKKQDYELIRHSRNNQASMRYHRRSKRTMIGHRCHSCKTKETPEWRRGPDGARTLCNACGLHYSKLLRRGSIGTHIENNVLKNRSQPNGVNNANNNEASLSDNYPFILIDPKCGFNKKAVPPSQTTNENQAKIANSHNSLPLKPHSKHKDNESNKTPLKIYQWKQ